MTEEQSNDVADQATLVGLPADRMLIDPQFAMTELMAIESRLHAANAGIEVGERANETPLMGYHDVLLSSYNSNQTMRFAHIRLEGMMMSRDRWYGAGVGKVVESIHAAYADKDVSGILFEVNTGGGEVTAAQMVAAAIKDRPKPVLAYGHMVASGGIMATMHADEIMASSPMAQFGSIGVMRTIPTWMYRYYSSYYKDIYSDHSPNKNRPSREYEGNASMQGWIDELNELALAFQEEVKAARPLRGDTKMTLSGEMFRGNEAKARGLVDSIGGYQQAFNRLATLARPDRI